MDTELATISRSRMDTPRTTNRQESSGRGIWQRRTSMEKALLGVCGVALVACAALVGVLATSSSSSSSPPELYSAPVHRSLDDVPQAPVQPMPQAQPLVLNKQINHHHHHHHHEPLHKHQEVKPVKSTRLPILRAQVSGGKQAEVCNTQECTLAAAAIIEAMDTSVDPCDNFYKFACGGWIKNNPVPDDASRWAQFDMLARELSNALGKILTEPQSPDDPSPINKAKKFYSGCMNLTRLEEVGVTPLTDFLEQFGGWPIASSEWDETTFKLQETIAQGKIQVGANNLIYVEVLPDEKDTYSTAIYIDQTSLGMPRSVLVSPDSYKERIAAYKAYINTTATILANSLGQNPTQVDADVMDILTFEMKLANITTPDEDRRDIERMYNPMTINDLKNITGTDWLPILAPIFASSDITVDGNTRIIVREPEYFNNLTQLLQNTSNRTLSNYLMWRHVKSLGDDTNQAMRDASFQYVMVANGVTAEERRENICADAANNYLGMAIGTKYVQTYFPQQAKDEVNEMVEDIRASFESLLDINDWMDAETKPKAVEKAEAISKSIGYPDWYGNTTALETYYANLRELDEVTHFDNVLAILSWYTSDEMDGYGKASERARWFMPPAMVNAYYVPEFNSITFPAGILQPPFYRGNSLMALNYGGIGQVIGHEITHGFDDHGRQNDKDGNAIPWWSNTTLNAFKDRAQCIVDQYDTIHLPELDELKPNTTLNGVNTQGENIADNGGLREALLAYKRYVDRNGEEPLLPGLLDYSPMQLLFLNNANIWCASITKEGLLNQVLTDPHSPSEFRVKIPMLNMKEFSTIWGCPAGSGMNPDHKCVVW